MKDEFARFMINPFHCNDDTADVELICKDCSCVEVKTWARDAFPATELIEQMERHNCERHDVPPVVALIDRNSDEWRKCGDNQFQLFGAGHPWTRGQIEKWYGPVAEKRG